MLIFLCYTINMNIKQILKTIYALTLVSILMSFTSCNGNVTSTAAPEPQISISALGLDGKAYVTWANENISNYTLSLNVDPAPDTGDFPRALTNEEREKNFLFIEGLQNGTEYTLTLELGNSTSTRKTTKVTPSANSVPEHTYDGSSTSSFIELSDGAVAIRIKNAEGKNISYANVNTSSTQTVSASLLQRFVDISESGSTQNITIKNGVTAQNNITAPLIKHYVQSADFSGKTILDRNNSVNSTFEKTNPQIGQTRYIYTEQDANFSTYKQELMTLYAIGYAPGSENIACLVWAKEEDLSTNSSGVKTSLGVIRDIAAKFLKFYKLEEKIFGTTSANLLTNTNSTSSYISMSNNGPTKDYVNIVLYDIGKDGIEGTCGITGYFDAKDYYTASTVNYSNEGKYLYIDIPFCNYEKIGGNVSYGGNYNSVSDIICGSIIHEYQHMINFNQKNNIAGIKRVDTWYNEMLSMLCEDLFGDALGIEAGEKTYNNFIPAFNGYYYNSGLRKYNENYPWISDAVSYTFGSFLLRNYGGTSLIHEMSTNNTQGAESVVAAVNTVNSTNLSWNDILKEYVKATSFRASYAKGKNIPNHNITRTGTNWTESLNIENFKVKTQNDILGTKFSGGNISTSIIGFNLWDEDYGNDISSDNQKYYGPLLLKYDERLELQPEGVIFHSIGVADSNDILLFFTDPATSNQKLWIFIQDAFEMTSQDSTSSIVQD